MSKLTLFTSAVLFCLIGASLGETLSIKPVFDPIMTCMCIFANGSSCCPEDFTSPTHVPLSLFAITCDCMLENGTSCCPETTEPVEPIITCDCMLMNGSSCCPSESPVHIIIGPMERIMPLEVDEEFLTLSTGFPIMHCDCLFANGSSCCPEDFENPTHSPLSLFALSCDCIFENGTSCCPETVEPVEPIITCDCMFASGQSCCPSNPTQIPRLTPIISEPLEPVMEPLVDDGFMIMSCMCMFANGSSCCPEDFAKPTHLPKSLVEADDDFMMITCDCMLASGQSCCPSDPIQIPRLTPIISEPVMEPLVDTEFMIMSCMCMFANGSSCCPEDFAKPTHLPKSLVEADDEFMIMTCDCMLADGKSCC